MNKTNLEIAKECGFSYQLTGEKPELVGFIEALDVYTARICEAKDAEIVKLHNAHVELERSYIQRLSEAQAQIAMQAETLNEISPFGSVSEHCAIAKKALSASAEAVAAWRAKETEPLRREVAMLRDVVIEYSECTWPCEVDYGAFEPRRSCCDTPLDSEHQNHCTASKAINTTKATALAYEREVENRGAVKALEEFGNKAGFGSATLLRMIAELRAANKGEVK